MLRLSIFILFLILVVSSQLIPFDKKCDEDEVFKIAELNQTGTFQLECAKIPCGKIEKSDEVCQNGTNFLTEAKWINDTTVSTKCSKLHSPSHYIGSFLMSGQKDQLKMDNSSLYFVGNLQMIEGDRIKVSIFQSKCPPKPTKRYKYSPSAFINFWTYFKQLLYSIRPKEMVVNLEIKDYPIKLLSIDRNSQVEKIKDVVEKLTGYPKDQQSVHFEGKELNSTKSLASYQIENDNTIEVKLWQKLIVMSINGTLTSLFQSGDKIEDLKMKIEGRWKIPIKQQVLYLNGQKLPNGTFNELGLQNGSTIVLTQYNPKFFVLYKNRMENFFLNDYEDFAVSKLNNLLKGLWYSDSGYARVKIELGDKTLDDAKKLSHYNLKDGDVLKAEQYQIRYIYRYDWN